jgi:hypothetical protein
VIKLEAQTVWRIVDGLDPGEGGAAFLVDEDGIVVAHRDRSLLFHSLTPLGEDAVRRVSPRDRFQTDEVPTLNVPALEAVRGAAAPGELDYVRPTDGSRRAVAYAPLREKEWVVAVDVDARHFDGPKQLRIWRDVVGAGLAVTLLTGLVLPVARRFVRSRRHGGGGPTEDPGTSGDPPQSPPTTRGPAENGPVPAAAPPGG